MQTQAEIGALIGRLAMVDDNFCEMLLVTVNRLYDEKPECFLADDTISLTEWVHFIRCLRACLPAL